MNCNQRPTDCCTYECTQGHNCPVRIQNLNICEGGEQIDTADSNEFTLIDGLIMGSKLFLILLSTVGAVMWAFYYFWGPV